MAAVAIFIVLEICARGWGIGMGFADLSRRGTAKASGQGHSAASAMVARLEVSPRVGKVALVAASMAADSPEAGSTAVAAGDAKLQ